MRLDLTAQACTLQTGALVVFEEVICHTLAVLTSGQSQGTER